MDCLRLTENNDWEGESWNFYFEATPEKEAALRDLLRLIDELGYSDSYELSDKRFTHDVVKTLIEHGNDGCSYMDEHNYVGELTSVPIPADFAESDPFYKGSFSNFCAPKPL